MEGGVFHRLSGSGVNFWSRLNSLLRERLAELGSGDKIVLAASLAILSGAKKLRRKPQFF